MADLFVAQNMGLLYSGALVVVARDRLGVVRGLLWSREIRFFTIALRADRCSTCSAGTRRCSA